jgi:hypothetical protein
MLLKARGLLDASLLHTIKGDAFVTPAQLQRDVARQLQLAGGRLALVDLPSLVAVDIVHCERAAAALAADAGSGATLVAGELFTPGYWDALAAEVDDELRQAGSVSLADLSRRHSLPAEQLAAALRARLGGAVQGRLESGLLYTDAYLARLAAQLRGALRASAAPCTLAELAAAAFEGSAEAGTHGGIAATLTAELLAAGAARGALRSGCTLWTPAVHARRQRDAVAAFYAGNGFVTYDAARRAGVPQPRAWLAAAHPGGVQLASALASPALLAQLDAALEEALAEVGWADAGAHLPPALGGADAAAAAAASQCVARVLQAGGALLADCCVLRADFLRAAAEAAQDAGRAAGAAAAARRKAAAATGSSAPPAASAEGARKTPKAGGAKSRRRSGAAASDSSGDEEDWSTAPKGKGAKGARGGGRGGKPASKPAATSQPDSRASTGAGVPSVGELAALLCEAHGALADAAGGALADALAEHVRGAAAAAFAEAEQAAAAAGSEARRRRGEALTARAAEALAQLQLFARGAELFASDDAVAPLLARHLLRAPGADAVDLLLLLLQDDEDAPPPPTTTTAGAPSGVLPEAQRVALSRALPAPLGAAGVAALEALAGRSVAALEAALEPLAGAAGVRLRKLDAKAERALLAAHRAALAAQLAEEEAPPAALLLAVPLLLASRCGAALILPGRALSAAVVRLAQVLSPEEASLLAGFHDAVVELLQLRGGEGAEARAAADAKHAALAEQLPGLRLLAAPDGS